MHDTTGLLALLLAFNLAFVGASTLIWALAAPGRFGALAFSAAAFMLAALQLRDSGMVAVADSVLVDLTFLGSVVLFGYALIEWWVRRSEPTASAEANEE